MKNFLLVLLLPCLLLVSCRDEDDDTCIEADYGVTLLVEVGDTYCFSDELEMKIVSLNNEFCPCGVDCVWEGQLAIEMEWKLADDSDITGWILEPGESVEHTHLSAMDDEMLLDDIRITTLMESIKYEVECSNDNPSPEVVSVELLIEK